MSASGSVAHAADPPWIIDDPERHPDFLVELDPHANLVLWQRPIHRRFVFIDETTGFVEAGFGFRATFELLDPLVPTINNTLGVTVGAEVTSCSSFCSDSIQWFIPVAAQWNFFLTDQWSAYVNLGGAIRTTDLFRNTFADLFAELGARYHFNETIALNMRTGYPFAISVGPSFFLGTRDNKD